MNDVMQKQFDILNLYLPIRTGILDALTDEDLAFKPELLPSIGDACVQIGEWQAAYLGGFKTFKQDFTYRNDNPNRAKSVQELRKWYEFMDGEIMAAIEAMSDEDIENKKIDRGGWLASVEWSLRIWQECLIIYYTKMLFYFKLMEREVPKGLAQWIE